MYNKKIVLFVTAILLITGLSITCAANVSDSTNDDNAVITQSAQNTKVADTTTVETNKKTITKNNERLPSLQRKPLVFSYITILYCCFRAEQRFCGMIRSCCSLPATTPGWMPIFFAKAIISLSEVYCEGANWI